MVEVVNLREAAVKVVKWELHKLIYRRKFVGDSLRKRYLYCTNDKKLICRSSVLNRIL